MIEFFSAIAGFAIALVLGAIILGVLRGLWLVARYALLVKIARGIEKRELRARSVDRRRALEREYVRRQQEVR